MQRFHTIAKPENFRMGMFNLCAHEIPIYFGSPLFGYPSLDIEGGKIIKANNLLVLDLNVIEYMRQRKNKRNIEGLLKYAAMLGLEITFIVGLSEQKRNLSYADSLYKELVTVLREDYFYDLPDKEVEKLLGVLSRHNPGITKNTGLFRDFLILIKYFYNKKWGIERKIREFATMIYEKNVPVFTFAFLVGCLYFYVKENRNAFSEKVVRKVQSDMDICSGEEEKRLWNVASDLMLFMAPTELFYNDKTGEYNFSYIASGDITVCLILSELCYAEIVVNQGRCFGTPGFRPTGIAGETLHSLVIRYLRNSRQHSLTKKEASDPRRTNLSNLVDELRSAN